MSALEPVPNGTPTVEINRHLEALTAALADRGLVAERYADGTAEEQQRRTVRHQRQR